MIYNFSLVVIEQSYSKYLQTYITSLNPLTELPNQGWSTSSKRPGCGQVD